MYDYHCDSHVLRVLEALWLSICFEQFQDIKRSGITREVYRHTPERVKIALVDPKRVTFPKFEQIPWLLSPVVKDSEAAISLMEELVAEMEKRYQLFELAGCPHLDAYNQKTSGK